MSDTVASQEIESIWERVKKYIDVKQITAVDRKGQKEQLERTMIASDPKRKGLNPQATMGYLTNKGFHSAFVENPTISQELITKQVFETKMFEWKGKRAVALKWRSGTIRESVGVGGRFITWGLLKEGESARAGANRLKIKKKL